MPINTAQELDTLKAADITLLADLQKKNSLSKPVFSKKTGLYFNNDAVANLAKNQYGSGDLQALETLLQNEGALRIPVGIGSLQAPDDTTEPVIYVAATEVNDTMPNHGDMSSMIYLRDHIQAARAFMALFCLNPGRYATEGDMAKRLLISALDLISTPAQLARFKSVIAHGTQVGQADWPHISIHFSDMNAVGPNGWRNIQDSFQMLGHLTLDALERGFIDPANLTKRHKTFLSSIAPLLESVGFPNYENSGSWEEIVAVRTSVMAIEVAFLEKARIALGTNYGNLLIPENSNHPHTLQHITTLLDKGLTELGRRLPYESPDYPAASIKYRQADIALAYVLMYDLPKLLAARGVTIGKDAQQLTATQIETLILDQLHTLDDPLTGGVVRYKDDSYQRVNFHTNEVRQTIRSIKNRVQKEAEREAREIDLDEKQRLRGELTPQGREAAWTHPLGQLASWAARRSLESEREGNKNETKRYEMLATAYFNRHLAAITGKSQWYATLNTHDLYELRPVPVFRFPECLISYQAKDRAVFTVPSPHTPLNWSTAMALESLGFLQQLATRRKVA